MAQEKDTPMPSSTDRSHVIRTSQQWESAIDKYSVIPWGVLCIELTPDGKTKAKVGEGNKFYSQLPYISNEIDLSNYYTKDEVDVIIENLEFMSIKETVPYDSRNALPRTGNKLGDVRFVKNLANPGDDPLMYIWNGTKWVFSGGSIIDIDLSEYAKKSEVYPRLQQLEALSHAHRNKNILDETSAVYTVEKDEKLASLKNYDVFVPATATTDGEEGLVPAPLAGERAKFLRGDGTWQTVSGGTQYQAGQGIEIEPVPELIDQHFNYTDYINTVQGVEHGSIVKNNNDSFTITSTANDAYTYPYNSGHGALYTMTVEPNTKYRLTVDLSDWAVDSYVNVFKNQTTSGWRADMPGDSYLEFTTESNTTVIAFRFGITYSGHTQTFSNIKVYQVSESVTTDSISAKLGSGLQFDANGAIEAIPYALPTASTSTLGGVIVGDGLEIDEEGVLSAPGGKTYVAGDGITITDSTSFELSEDVVTNTEYLFDTQVTSSVSGRTYTKYNTEPALGAIVYYASSYTQPFFVGLTADSVKYGTDYDSHIWPNPDHPTFEYKGVTWYYSDNAYGMPGDRTDASGHMQKLPGSYSVSTEADLQNIAKAIIDAADIITDPTKIISAKIGEGLSFDSNDALQVNVGDGLEIDANNDINVDISRTTIFFNNNPNS